LVEREKPRIVIQEMVERKLLLPVPEAVDDLHAARLDSWRTASATASGQSAGDAWPQAVRRK
jgi:hypothetical protein